MRTAGRRQICAEVGDNRFVDDEVRRDDLRPVAFSRRAYLLTA